MNTAPFERKTGLLLQFITLVLDVSLAAYSIQGRTFKEFLEGCIWLRSCGVHSENVTGATMLGAEGEKSEHLESQKWPFESLNSTLWSACSGVQMKD